MLPVQVQLQSSEPLEGDITYECGFCGLRRGPESDSHEYHSDSVLSLLIFRERLRGKSDD